MTRPEAEALSKQEFKRVRNQRYIRVFYLKGYAENGDTLECVFDDGIIVRVDNASEGELTRWMGDWLDPLWPVTPLESADLADGHGWEVYGTSFHVPTGSTEWTKWDPVSRIRGLLMEALS